MMDSLTAFTLVLGAIGVVGGGFMLWVLPRIEAGSRRRERADRVVAE
jgi:hypothetical protein